MASSSSSSSTSRSWKYDVFLSFRGKDTRDTFIDHLYLALEQHNILTYKDDVTLERGDPIVPALFSAIYESHIVLIIFSENYADSSWCLDELSYIMKCKEEDRGQFVIPIFYNVDPSDVSEQKGKYGKAFATHELSENKNKVEPWKKALVDASNIAGLEPKHVANGREAAFIQEIAGDILKKLSSLNLKVEDEMLVGMGTRLEQLKSQLRIGSGGVRMVGIWGLGGGGKTTLATSFYRKFSPNFNLCCFLGEIREKTKLHGLQSRQEKLLKTVFGKKIQVESVELGRDKIEEMLYRRKVLFVLDDVDNLEQLEALAGSHKWFGDGSRIIITTRDREVLESHRVDEVCPVSLLSDEEAIRLFKIHAYRKHNPVEDYEKLSLRVISYANGLPLALRILGKHLYISNKDQWVGVLDKLKKYPNMKLVEKLKISYDGLGYDEKMLFLDIACFFRKTKTKDEAMEILDAFGFSTIAGVTVLIQKALISVSKDGYFDMHDMVQEMAYYIVRQEDPENPENHSRVWRSEDVNDICSRNATMENHKIEAMESCSSSSDFMMLVSNMKKLRYLKVNPSYCLVDEGPNFLSNALRYMDWRFYPATPFPERFQPQKLAVLKMESSFLKELWKGKQNLPCLRELVLYFLTNLVRTPDFGGLPRLQKLRLDGCISLEEIHESLGNHSSLVQVSVCDCNKLTRFPAIGRMNKLEILGIVNCKAFIEFPMIKTKMDSLVELCLCKVPIKVLPSSVGKYCTKLTFLSLECCSELKRIDGNFHALERLENFEFKDCGKLEKLPKHLFNENLDGFGLWLDRISIRQLPSPVPRFLNKLCLTWCSLRDGDIPNEIGELSNLRELYLEGNWFKRLDFSLSRLTRLKLLDLSQCSDLVELPELPSSLAILQAKWCDSLEVIYKDDAHIKCEWLCEVSIWGRKGWRQDISGGARLLESMLEGKAVKNRCMILELKVIEIPKSIDPRVVSGERCKMQLRENWYNDYSGFLFCAASNDHLYPIISMKHVEKSVGDFQDDDDSMGMKDYNDLFWVMHFLPFSLLRQTSWWDPTSTAVEMECRDSYYSEVRMCGLMLVPKEAAENSSSGGQKETTPTHPSSSSSSSSDDDDDLYKSKLDIQHDSSSDFKFRLSHYPLHRPVKPYFLQLDPTIHLGFDD